jgi:hypothetical protein
MGTSKTVLTSVRGESVITRSLVTRLMDDETAVQVLGESLLQYHHMNCPGIESGTLCLEDAAQPLVYVRSFMCTNERKPNSCSCAKAPHHEDVCGSGGITPRILNMVTR